MKLASSKVGTSCQSPRSNNRAVVSQVLPTGGHWMEAVHMNELISPPTKPMKCVSILEAMFRKLKCGAIDAFPWPISSLPLV